MDKLGRDLVTELGKTKEQLEKLHRAAIKVTTPKEDHELQYILRQAQRLDGGIQDLLIREQ